MKDNFDMLSSIIKTVQMGQIGIRSVLDSPMSPGIQKALRQVLQELFAVFQHGGTFGFLPVAIFAGGAETAGFNHILKQFCKVVLAEVVHGVKAAAVCAIDFDFAGFVCFDDFHIPVLSFLLGCWG